MHTRSTGIVEACRDEIARWTVLPRDRFGKAIITCDHMLPHHDGWAAVVDKDPQYREPSLAVTVLVHHLPFPLSTFIERVLACTSTGRTLANKNRLAGQHPGMVARPKLTPVLCARLVAIHHMRRFHDNQLTLWEALRKHRATRKRKSVVWTV